MNIYGIDVLLHTVYSAPDSLNIFNGRASNTKIAVN